MMRTSQRTGSTPPLKTAIKKGDATDRGNYSGLKLMENVMKVLERVLESLIRSQVEINNMQFGFMSGRSTTDAIYILRQMQEKHLIWKTKIYFAFVDLEKAFDRVPPSVFWWAMRSWRLMNGLLG